MKCCRVAAAVTLLLMAACAGGWPSITVGSVVSSPGEQMRFIRWQADLLHGMDVRGLFQITFYDIDLTGFPPQPPGSPIGLFTHLGLADSAMTPKLALAVWDSVFHEPYRPN